MAGYNTIRGLRVKYLSADPAGAEDGQVWYNSTTGNLRVDGIALAGSWASGANMGTTRAAAGGAGTQTAGLAFGGRLGAPITSTANSEEYNGSSWSEGNNMVTGRTFLGSAGTQTAALGAGGANDAPTANTGMTNSEKYDGTSWTATNALNTARYAMYVAGTTGAALAAGGYNNTLPPSNATNITEEFDGTNWSAVPGNLGSTKYRGVGTGTQTAGLACLGYIYPGGNTNQAEEYNGTSWTAGGTANTARSALGGCGTQTATLVFGGTSTSVAAESYDGSSWTTQPSLAQGRDSITGAASGTTSAALGFGGRNGPTLYNNTEEFTGASTQIKNISVS